MPFARLGIPADLLAALERQQITEPTPIQTAAVPVLLAGSDAYLHAETGTGKTLAYLLPLFMRMDAGEEATQVVILAPTHELAIQIHRQCGELAVNAGRPIRSLLLIGGTSMERQVDKLKKKPHIVVGSLGRITELIRLRKLKPQAVRAVVIDEADRLLAAESLPAIRALLQSMPVARQLIFASATEQPEATAALARLAPDLVTVRAGAAAVNANIDHVYVTCDERDKPDMLRKALHAMRPERAMVFVHRGETAEEIAAKLAHHKIAAADLHGARDKLDRQKAMEAFRDGRIHVLIASDIGARGLDLPGVTHVFNVDVPTQAKAYLHRVGRTGRAGAKGQAVSLATPQDVRMLRKFERELGIAIRPVRLRDGRVLETGEAPAHD